MQDYFRERLMWPMAGEAAWWAYKKAVDKFGNYKHYTAPAILSQKINQMPPRKQYARGGPKSVAKAKPKQSPNTLLNQFKMVAKRRKTINTPGGSKMAVRRFGAVASKSGGIIRRLRKVKRSVKKARHIFRGVEKTVEAFKNEGTTSQCLNIGHGTFAVNQMLDIGWKAILKAAFNKHRININDWNDLATPFSAIPQAAPAQWQIGLEYNEDNVVQNRFFSPISTTTYQDIVNWFADVVARPYYNPNAVIRLDKLFFYPVTGITPISTGNFGVYSLRNCKISFEVKSCMKMQNRSINSTGNDQVEDVDNVPVYGKVYEFSGTGLYRPKNAGDAVVNINRNTGYYLAFDGGNYREPIDALYYERVKRAGKFKLEPGEIKTSYLTHVVTMTLFKLIHLASQGELISAPNISAGKNRMFSMEKIIDTLADPNPSGFGMSIAVEVNNRYRATASTFDKYHTVPTFSRVAI